jgi:hypothetical protein
MPASAFAFFNWERRKTWQERIRVRLSPPCTRFAEKVHAATLESVATEIIRFRW